MLVEVVLSHEERTVVRVGDVFIKVDTNPDRVQREMASLHLVSAVPVPEVLWSQPGTPHVLAVAALRGTPLAVLGSPCSHSKAAWVAAGRAARDLHEQAVPESLSAPSRYRLEDVAELEERLLAHTAVDRSIVTEHARRARAASERATNAALVHGDFQAAHVFIDDGDAVSGIIDWGDAGTGDPHYDLAVLTVGHHEFLDDVLSGYGGEVDRDRIEGYWSWRRLGSIRWMIEHGFDPSGDIKALNRS